MFVVNTRKQILNFNKEISFISLSLIMLLGLIGLWLNTVYHNKVAAMITETNVEFFKALEDVERKLIFRKSFSTDLNPRVNHVRHTNSNNDSIKVGQIVFVKLKTDTIKSDDVFHFEDMLSGSKKDTATTFTVRIEGASAEFSFGNEDRFFIDIDSSKAVLLETFNDRISQSKLSGHEFSIIEANVDSSIDLPFVSAGGKLDNIFAGSHELYVVAEGYWKGAVKRMIPEILFSFLLFAAIAGALFFMYSNLINERKLAEIKDDFVSNISHELKTPISIVNVAIEAISNFDVTDKKKTEEYLNISSKELNRLDQLVDKLLDIDSEGEVGSHKQERIHVGDAVRMVAKSMELKSRLNIDDSSENATVSMNAKLFNSMIYCLLDNAVKYDPNKEPINISLRTEKDFVRIEVKDNGVGILNSETDKIFTKFYRSPNKNIHDVKGHGLGLYFAKKHVEEVGGNISVSSDQLGSTFKINLPLYHGG